jgi:phosphatidate phosphatase APP1
MGRRPGPAQPDHLIKPASLWQRLARRWRDPVIILPYLTYGTARRLTVCGRVLEDEGFLPAADADTDTRWRNLVRFYKRLESDEVPGARLRARFLGIEIEAVTDSEGYFRLELAPRGRLGPGLWQEIEIELIEPVDGVRAVAEVLVPPLGRKGGARFGVISDIDDTIVSSRVSNKLKLILTVALTNARTRKPFAGVAAFYRALHAGVNPFFYVSKSPWNLYAPLLEYLEVQGLPRGPLMLRDFGFRSEKEHKRKAIEAILGTYPKLKFILIGDSGEEDPEIYSALVHRFPERIRAIYIRSVNPKRIAEIEKLATQVAKTGCQLVLAPDSEPAAAHAAAEGLIQASELRAVRAEKASDSSSSKPALSSGALK